MKRFLDFTFAFILLIILFPILAVIALLVKVTSRGPVFFKQRRIGLYKKEFQILKFRTMFLETPQNVATHLLENPNSYITALGKFLRKTSLDELPQLYNILKGEMSFVGHRPALYNQYDLISLRDKYCIHEIRPGITGWAQINGRDEIEIPVKVQLDKYYLENKSIWLDIKIVFLTFVKVILLKGVIEGKQQPAKKIS